jgi:1,4-alpha-glucan branching enzyme
MLTGDFNNWQDDISLEKVDESGIWEVDVPSDIIFHGNRYKYRIYGCGQLYYKSDPYAHSLSQIPENSSIIRKKDEYRWRDKGWLAYRSKYQKNISAQPMNVYELHLSSWKSNGRGGALNYKDYARELAPYVKQMGYTHVCLLPINEFFDGDKINYVPRGLFAPTSKYGTPDDLKAFVDNLHEAGVGVIFDIPIVNFLKEKYKLFDISGGMFYGHIDNDRIKHFDLTQGSVRSLLLSSVSYWIREYHADAIRISNVDELLRFYFDANDVNKENNIAKDFLKSLVKVIKKNYPDVLLIEEGNDTEIGFDLVFNELVSERLLEYSSVDFAYRGSISTELFGLMEKNPSGTVSIGYDEPIHKRNTLIESMAGDYWQKFAGLRALLGLMMTARGKKLSFMGNEIAQFKPWQFGEEIEWFLLDFESHEKLQRYVAELNNFYLAHSALWQRDSLSESMCFIDRDTFEQNILIFRRSSKNEELTVVVNLSPNSYNEYRIGAQDKGTYSEIFNSDKINYYGSGVTNNDVIETEAIEYHGYKNSFVMRIPPLAISILSFKKK